MKKKITGLALGSMLLALSFPVEAQRSRKVVRIGYLGNNQSPWGLSVGEENFLQELRKREWIEGQNLLIERRYWENRVDRLLTQATELVRLKVDIIVTNTGTAARAAKNATTTIPIVMVSSADAVIQGLVISLARPGGNVTGLTTNSPLVAGKQLEILKEAFPRVSRVAVLRCGRRSGPSGPSSPAVGKEHWNEAQNAARAQKIHLLPVALDGPEGIEGALGVVLRERADGLLVSDCVLVPAAEIVELAAKSRLPAIYPFGSFVKRGGLMSYGADERESFRRAAQFVDKILKGAKPADLPVEQPTKFELIINLKTAKALGLNISPEVLMWADEVIE
jgi:putative ABC transport system substrate-binding protein